MFDKLEEINYLVNIKQYIICAINDYSIEKTITNELSEIRFLIDKKIISLITNKEFKEYVNFADSKKVLDEVIRRTNLKSSFSK